MKKYKLLWAACLTLGGLTACQENAAPKNETVAQENVAEKDLQPMADTPQTATTNLNIGNHRYAVTLRRAPDESLPLVVDELDQRFYDNAVEISILRDDAEWFAQKVTKDTFGELLSDAERKGSLLLGMSCDTARCDRSRLCFTAQVGQAGEGPAFLYLVPTGGGAPSVQRDNLQEEINYEDSSR